MLRIRLTLLGVVCFHHEYPREFPRSLLTWVPVELYVFGNEIESCFTCSKNINNKFLTRNLGCTIDKECVCNNA